WGGCLIAGFKRSATHRRMGGTAMFALVVGYLLGSIPFGLLLTRLAGKGDIRDIGSGNIGATNVLRTGSKGLAAGTLLLDALKGAAAVLLAQRFWQAALVYALLWIGLLAVLRISSVAGMAAAASTPITAAILGKSELFPM